MICEAEILRDMLGDGYINHSRNGCPVFIFCWFLKTFRPKNTILFSVVTRKILIFKIFKINSRKFHGSDCSPPARVSIPESGLPVSSAAGTSFWYDFLLHFALKRQNLFQKSFSRWKKQMRLKINQIAGEPNVPPSEMSIEPSMARR